MDERRELAEDLCRVVGGRVLGALEILFEPDELSGEDTRLRELLAVKSRAWADVLCGEDDRAAAFLAIRLVSALYPGDAPFDPPAAWWGTPLGRAVARARGTRLRPRCRSRSPRRCSASPARASTTWCAGTSSTAIPRVRSPRRRSRPASPAATATRPRRA
ncbi:hypothetical protein [Microbispora sp. GKU 823]|uniref:hypothetical protein n=1 Tax=Microbispora sp. GKU 823 TaxID=1652100 RepID=UPI001C4DF3EF|nr:hypothetical protein [Microbispora sp. GKU 823]